MNLEQVSMSYQLQVNQNNLFSKEHEKYTCVLYYKGKKRAFTYQCHISVRPNKEDLLYCLLLDRRYVRDGLEEFLESFGYDRSSREIKRGKKFFEGIEKNNERLSYLFTDEELEELEKIF